MPIRNSIVIDEAKCNGCGACITGCHERALAIVHGKAKLVKESYCDGLGACIGTCPRNAITIVEREAEAFNEEKVNARLQGRRDAESMDATKQPSAHAATPCGCPSARVMTFNKEKKVPGGIGQERGDRCQVSGVRNSLLPSTQHLAPDPSSLTHWPVQLRLVPVTAPFLKGSDLLITADCVPVAYGGFQQLLRGKTVVMGCPKFDNTAQYEEKLTDLFRHAGFASVTVAVMEVPCCSALARVVRNAYTASGARFPINDVVVGINGERK